MNKRKLIKKNPIKVGGVDIAQVGSLRLVSPPLNISKPSREKCFSKKIFAFCLLLSLIISLNANAQITKEPELLNASNEFNSKRLTTVVIGETALASVVTIGLQYLWYKKYPKSRFHFFNDDDEWLQMDKMGHATTAYNISAVQYNLMRWSGVNRTTSEWVGGATGFAYLIMIEIMDGFSKEWGFSKGDMEADFFGSAFFTGQQALWKEQRIQMRFSFHKSIFANYNPNELGANFPQRLIKDYNAQSYWFSFNIHSFLNKGNNFPSWINADLGYGADGMTGAVINPKEVNGKPIPTFKRSRKFFFGVDGAFNKPGTIPFPSWINIFRIPTPVIELKEHKILFRPFYF
ncbi:MAG TPA: DUF2279 domain-containing protein [Hanamia sp.]|nr:DUF2279 domain-containing protein [Hanamia sp.]